MPDDLDYGSLAMDAGVEPMPAETASPTGEEVGPEEMAYAEEMKAALEAKDTAGFASSLKQFIIACTGKGYSE